MSTPNVIFQPIVSNIQKIVVYETKNQYILIGSINTQNRFRVLKIDRTEPKQLLIVDDKVDYTQDEIHKIVNMIEMGNRSRSGQRSNSITGSSKIISAFGIVGFIRFLEGYYIILVTKRRRIAAIGLHTIYKIEDTCMIYIPNETVRIVHQDEPRYVKMFQNIDLSSNFYYSYSYDITHTLQHNMSPPRYVQPNYLKKDVKNSPSNDENGDVEDANEQTSLDWIFPQDKPTDYDRIQIYGIRHKPNRKFVWNTYLLSNVESELHPAWVIYVIHGFIDQSNISVFGRSIYITLIARRSNKYAGTRFLKRGANFDGDVANEVETEQMVHDSGVSSFVHGHFSSFVQMRGSIPGHWSQDTTRMVPKPTIAIDLNDPYCETAGAHMNELFKRYGAPIIILNLVKKKEKKKHESFLSEEMSGAVEYLNQFLPPKHHIQYISFDMARKNKGRVAKVMGMLATIAHDAVMKTGIYTNHPPYYSQKTDTIIGSPNQSLNNGRLQMGIIRTNCVDCLDRTNTAQFAIGKCALGFQLCALGILDTPKLEFDSDCVRMLECLYEDHGDTLALQYGGSQLVHRIKTYRKTAPWTSQGNDIMNTLSRYYSNTFSDAEKQNTINLFLGLFIPREQSPPIWEYITDYYMHHRQAINYTPNFTIPKTQWWEPEVLKSLPKPYNDITRGVIEIIQIHNRDAEMIDAYIDYHRLNEVTPMNEHFAYKMSNSVRDFMPNLTVDYSPFTPRVRPGRRREETAKKGETMKNPSLTGQSSQPSDSSSSEDSELTDDETNGIQTESQNSGSKSSFSTTFTFESLFPSMRQVYGTEPEYPKRPDILLYKRYVLVGHKANGTLHSSNLHLSKSIKLFQKNTLPSDSCFKVKTPIVTPNSVNIYEQYVNKGKFGGVVCNPSDYSMYSKYARNEFQCK